MKAGTIFDSKSIFGFLQNNIFECDMASQICWEMSSLQGPYHPSTRRYMSICIYIYVYIYRYDF